MAWRPTLGTDGEDDDQAQTRAQGEPPTADGEFDPPPLVFHALGAVSGVTKCEVSAPTNDIRPGELDARAEIGQRGGRLCTLCFV
jgi:hypothetical protein